MTCRKLSASEIYESSSSSKHRKWKSRACFFQSNFGASSSLPSSYDERLLQANNEFFEFGILPSSLLPSTSDENLVLVNNALAGFVGYAATPSSLLSPSAVCPIQANNYLDMNFYEAEEVNVPTTYKYRSHVQAVCRNRSRSSTVGLDCAPTKL